LNSEVSSTTRQWPDPPAEEAFYGLAGDVVRTIGPHTEASRVALLIQTLASFGNVLGRAAYFTAEASRHTSIEFPKRLWRDESGKIIEHNSVSFSAGIRLAEYKLVRTGTNEMMFKPDRKGGAR
jgi:hypothetical protein